MPKTWLVTGCSTRFGRVLAKTRAKFAAVDSSMDAWDADATATGF